MRRGYLKPVRRSVSFITTADYNVGEEARRFPQITWSPEQIQASTPEDELNMRPLILTRQHSTRAMRSGDGYLHPTELRRAHREP